MLNFQHRLKSRPNFVSSIWKCCIFTEYCYCLHEMFKKLTLSSHNNVRPSYNMINVSLLCSVKSNLFSDDTISVHESKCNKITRSKSTILRIRELFLYRHRKWYTNPPDVKPSLTPKQLLNTPLEHYSKLPKRKWPLSKKHRIYVFIN